MGEAEAACAELEQQVEQHRDRITDLEEQLLAASTKHEQHAKHSQAKHEVQLQKLRDQVTELSGKGDAAARELDARREALGVAQARVTELESQLAEAVAAHRAAEARCSDQADAHAAEVSDIASTLREQLEAVKREASEATEAREAAVEEAATAATLLAQAQAEQVRLQAQVGELSSRAAGESELQSK